MQKQNKAKAYNQYSYTTRKTHHEKFTKPSMTIPDQAVSVQTILDRHARGLPITGARVPIYDLDPDGNGVAMPDLAKMDLSEIHDMASKNMERIHELQEEMRKSHTNKEKERLRETMKQELVKAGWTYNEPPADTITPPKIDEKK